ncbi:Abcb9 [Scenedesmus sp. PABB004]|nr:Abcb9 [Scenedesmus sp. PABB004]
MLLFAGRGLAPGALAPGCVAALRHLARAAIHGAAAPLPGAPAAPGPAGPLGAPKGAAAQPGRAGASPAAEPIAESSRTIKGLLDGLLQQQEGRPGPMPTAQGVDRPAAGGGQQHLDAAAAPGAADAGCQPYGARASGAQVRMDSQLIFDSCWRRFRDKHGMNFSAPREVIWLNGAPGSGKGVSTPHIMKARGMARSVCVSSLLSGAPEARGFIEAGEMIGDHVVGDLLLEALLLPASAGLTTAELNVVIDGFPRTAVQVDFVKLLEDKLRYLHTKFMDTPLGPRFPRPAFKVVMLYVDEATSIGRQLARAAAAQAHNARAKDAGGREAGLRLAEERVTDALPDRAHKRYSIFRQHYPAILRLKQFFAFHLIDACGSPSDTQEQILQELRYQSSLDLSEEAYAAIRHLPLAKDLQHTARQQLVSRLEAYARQQRPLFARVLALLQGEVLPLLEQGALCGAAEWVTQEELFAAHPAAIGMLLDVVTDRGFSAHYVREALPVPFRFDAASGAIETRVSPLHRFRFAFAAPGLRDGGALKALEIAARITEASRGGAGGAGGADAGAPGAAAGGGASPITESFIPAHLDVEARMRAQEAARGRARVALAGAGGGAAAATAARAPCGGDASACGGGAATGAVAEGEGDVLVIHRCTRPDIGCGHAHELEVVNDPRRREDTPVLSPVSSLFAYAPLGRAPGGAADGSDGGDGGGVAQHAARDAADGARAAVGPDEAADDDDLDDLLSGLLGGGGGGQLSTTAASSATPSAPASLDLARSSDASESGAPAPARRRGAPASPPNGVVPGSPAAPARGLPACPARPNDGQGPPAAQQAAAAGCAGGGGGDAPSGGAPGAALFTPHPAWAAQGACVRRVAVFLTPASRELLLSLAPPLHELVSADHMPLATAPPIEHVLLSWPLGAEVPLAVIGGAADARVQAVAADPPPWLPPTTCAATYITLSCALGARPEEGGLLVRDALARVALGGGGAAPPGAVGAYRAWDEPLPLVGRVGVLLGPPPGAAPGGGGGREVVAFSPEEMEASGLVTVGRDNLERFYRRHGDRLGKTKPDTLPRQPSPPEPYSPMAQPSARMPFAPAAGGDCWSPLLAAAPGGAPPPYQPPLLQLGPPATPVGGDGDDDDSASTRSGSSGSADAVQFKSAVRAGDAVALRPFVPVAGRARLVTGRVREFACDEAFQGNGVMVVLDDNTIGFVTAVLVDGAAASSPPPPGKRARAGGRARRGHRASGGSGGGLQPGASADAAELSEWALRAHDGAGLGLRLRSEADAAHDMELWDQFDALQREHGEALCSAILAECGQDFVEAIALIRAQHARLSAGSPSSPAAPPAPPTAGEELAQQLALSVGLAPGGVLQLCRLAPEASPECVVELLQAAGGDVAKAADALMTAQAAAEHDRDGGVRAAAAEAAEEAQARAAALKAAAAAEAAEEARAHAAAIAAAAAAEAAEEAREHAAALKAAAAAEAAEEARAHAAAIAAAAAAEAAEEAQARAAALRAAADAEAAEEAQAHAAAIAAAAAAEAAEVAQAAQRDSAAASAAAAHSPAHDPELAAAVGTLCAMFPELQPGVAEMMLQDHGGHLEEAARSVQAAQQREHAAAPASGGGSARASPLLAAHAGLSEADQLAMLEAMGELDLDDRRRSAAAAAGSRRAGGYCPPGSPPRPPTARVGTPLMAQQQGAAGGHQDDAKRAAKEAADKLYERSRTLSNAAQVYMTAAQALLAAGDAAGFRAKKDAADAARAGSKAAWDEAQRLSWSANNAAEQEWTVDLHGLGTSVALRKFAVQFDGLSAMDSPGGIRYKVVTGKGKHSEGNVPRIKLGVLQFLEERRAAEVAAAGGRPWAVTWEVDPSNEGPCAARGAGMVGVTLEIPARGLAEHEDDRQSVDRQSVASIQSVATSTSLAQRLRDLNLDFDEGVKSLDAADAEDKEHGSERSGGAPLSPTAADALAARPPAPGAGAALCEEDLVPPPYSLHLLHREPPLQVCCRLFERRGHPPLPLKRMSMVQVEDFRTHGYVVVDGLLSRDAAARIKAETLRMAARGLLQPVSAANLGVLSPAAATPHAARPGLLLSSSPASPGGHALLHPRGSGAGGGAHHPAAAQQQQQQPAPRGVAPRWGELRVPLVLGQPPADTAALAPVMAALQELQVQLGAAHVAPRRPPARPRAGTAAHAAPRHAARTQDDLGEFVRLRSKGAAEYALCQLPPGAAHVPRHRDALPDDGRGSGIAAAAALPPPQQSHVKWAAPPPPPAGAEPHVAGSTSSSCSELSATGGPQQAAPPAPGARQQQPQLQPQQAQPQQQQQAQQPQQAQAAPALAAQQLALSGPAARRVSIFVFVNHDWDREHGGGLRLWPPQRPVGPPSATAASATARRSPTSSDAGTTFSEISDCGSSLRVPVLGSTTSSVVAEASAADHDTYSLDGLSVAESEVERQGFEWVECEGGEMALDIAPLAGRVVVLLSGAVEHALLPGGGAGPGSDMAFVRACGAAMPRPVVVGALIVAAWALELGVVTWCTLWPIAGHIHDLRRFAGWAQLYQPGTSTLDVWVLALARVAVLAALWAATVPGAARRQRSLGGSLGPPRPPNCEQTAFGAALASGVCELLLLAKAVAVAVWAPDALLPPRGQPGVAGLLPSYGAIVASLLCSLGSGLALRGAIAARGAPPRCGKGDEEAGDAAAPLLARSRGAASWEVPQNNKALRGDGGDGDDGDDASPPVQPATVLELVRLSLPDAPLLVVAFLAGTAAALAAACVPYYTGQIIDYASIDPDRRRFAATTGKLVGVAGLCGVFTGLRGGVFSVAMWRLNVRLRRALFGALLAQEVGFYDKVQTGEISSRLSADTTTVSDSVSLNLNVLVRSATSAAMVLGFMFAASWRLTVVTFVLVPCVLLISKVYGAFYRRLSKKAQAALAEANAVAEEVLSAQATVRAHAAQGSAAASYADRLAVFYALMARQAGVYAVYAATTTFLPSLVVATVLYYGGCLVLGGEMSAGALVSFMLYQQSLSAAFSSMGDVFSALTAAVGAADKVVELIKRVPREPPPGAFVPPSGRLVGSLALQSVVFAYPIRPSTRVLNCLSLAVNPGEVVALVGPSGGGKSTIIKLLQRFYVPLSGAVLVDGLDVGAYEPRWLRRHVALVAQEPVLFARSVRRNIIYGLEPEDGAAPPSQEAIEEAARQANAHDFVSAFPERYETGCGEKGVVLSGGQKQRIAIARALVRAPQVLLLDEATSALDTESEAVVQEALSRLMAGRTVVVVAHRLSTVRDATRICVVAGGVVAEQGSHDELIGRGGLYSQLVARQLTASPSGAALSALSRGLSASSLGGLSAGDELSEGSRGGSVDAPALSGGAALTPRGARASPPPRRPE